MLFSNMQKSIEKSVESAIMRLTRDSKWTLVEEINLDFPCYHPQGLDRFGDNLFLTSAEILEETIRYTAAPSGEQASQYDRSPGRGQGHVFEMTEKGQLVRHWKVGEGTIYHPGGLTYDGESLWIPVAEYRPNSHSIMYRIDPITGKVTEAFRYDDHLGGVARDPDTGLLHIATWGSRRFLTMTTSGELQKEIVSQSYFVDFQDCICAENGSMIWSGIAEYPNGSGGVFELGGIAIIDMDTGYFKFEVPITTLSPGGRVITYNATHLDVLDDRLRMYAIPDDAMSAHEARMLVLETTI